MSELDLRLHCLALAVKALKEHDDPLLVKATASCIYDFLAPACAGHGIEHNAANVHLTHPTMQ